MKPFNIQKWNDEMQKVVIAVQKGERGTKLAAQRYRVPRSTPRSANCGPWPVFQPITILKRLLKVYNSFVSVLIG